MNSIRSPAFELLRLATGVGGVLLSRGRPLTGVHGAAGEFGHMPLTGGTEECRCGSIGCWELDAGSHGLLRRAGRTEEGDRIDLALGVIGDAATDPGCARALAGVAESAAPNFGSPSTKRKSYCRTHDIFRLLFG